MLPSEMGMVCPRASLDTGKTPLYQVACVVIVITALVLWNLLFAAAPRVI